MRKGWIGITAAAAASAVAVLAVALAGPAGGAPSPAFTFAADGPAVPGLSGLNENPPRQPPSTATGTTTVLWGTTNSMTVNVAFNGLTTPNTAAHIHCCADAPNNAGVATTTPTFTGFPGGVTSGTYTRTFDMTNAASYNPAFVSAQGGVANAEAALLGGLLAGRAYMNIHTQMFGGGEVRGFLHPVSCLTGPQYSPLTVAAGEAVCVAPGAMVFGPITVNPGGALSVDGAFVAGPIQAQGATYLRVCGSQVAGPLTASGNTGLVLVGGDAATGPCAGNMIMGPGSLTNNTAGVEFNANSVFGPLTISGTTGTLPPPDTGSVHAADNTVYGPSSIS